MRQRDRARLQKAIDGGEWESICKRYAPNYKLESFARHATTMRVEIAVHGTPAEQATFDALTRAIATRLLGECK